MKPQQRCLQASQNQNESKQVPPKREDLSISTKKYNIDANLNVFDNVISGNCNELYTCMN